MSIHTANPLIGDRFLLFQVLDHHLLGGHELAFALVKALETNGGSHVAVHGNGIGGFWREPSMVQGDAHRFRIAIGGCVHSIAHP